MVKKHMENIGEIYLHAEGYLNVIHHKSATETGNDNIVKLFMKQLPTASHWHYHAAKLKLPCMKNIPLSWRKGTSNHFCQNLAAVGS